MKISDEHLLEVAEVRRWPRLFEVIGNCRSEVSVKATELLEEEASDGLGASLDTKNLSDGGNRVVRWLEDPRGWRERLEAMGYADWEVDFYDRLQMIRRLRKEHLAEKFPHALFQDLNGLVQCAKQRSVAQLIRRVAVYTRVSTTDQNCKMQLQELRTYAQARGWQIVNEFKDEGWSGTRADRLVYSQLAG